jgi:tetratricopeptide (TPR) repeat protein
MARKNQSQTIALGEEDIFRYPGARPFQDNEYAPLLFYGREDEQEQALRVFEKWRTLVVRGRQAVGKTSFLRAGLFPQLRRDHYLPIYARPSDLVRGGLTGYIRTMPANGQEVLRRLEREEAGNSLKAQMRAIAAHAREKNQVPVLVIDQVEQLVTQLRGKPGAELTADLREFLQSVLDDRQSAKSQKAGGAGNTPDFGLVLSVQTDFLPILGRGDYALPLEPLPTVELKPLNRAQAERAVVKPGFLNLAGLSTAQMDFDEAVVERLMELLTDRGRVEEIEPLHIQLLCRDIEDTILVNDREGLLGNAPVIPAFLGSENGLRVVLRRFYQNQIDSIEKYALRMKARALCERGLINSQAEAQSLKAGTLSRRFGLSGEELHKLLEMRLIGLEAADDTYRCSLSHPSLVEPILESRKERLAKAEGLFFRTCMLILLVCFLGFAGYRYGIRPLLEQRDLAERAQQPPPSMGGVLGGAEAEQATATGPAQGEQAGEGTAAPAPPVAPSRPRTPEAQAVHYDSIGATQDALEMYDYVLRRNPAHPFAATRAARLYTDLGREEEGLALLQDIGSQLRLEVGDLQEAPDLSEAQVVSALALGRNYRAMADLFEVEGNVTEAEEYFRQAANIFREVLKQTPDSQMAERELLDTLQALGELNYQQKAFEHAEEIFSEAVLIATNEGGSPTTPLLWRARARRAASDYLGAIEDYSRIIREHPDRASYLYERAETWFQMRDYNQCLQDCYKANLRDADNALVYNLVAEAYMETERFDQAIDHFTRAVNLDPRLFRAYLRRAGAYLQQGDFEKAVEDYTRMIELQPHRHSTYGNRGIAYKRMGNAKKALRDFTHLINYYPDDAKAFYNRANTYFDLGDYSSAILDYDQALNLRPDFARAYNNRGLAHYALGELEAAVDGYTRAIELENTYDYAYSNRGRVYQDLQQMEKALEDYNTAITLNPRNAVALGHRGEYFYETGNLPEALDDLNRAIELQPDNPHFYYIRAEVHEKLGNVDLSGKDIFRAEQLEGAAERRRMREESEAAAREGETAAPATPGQQSDALRRVPRETDPLDLFR